MLNPSLTLNLPVVATGLEFVPDIVHREIFYVHAR